MTLSDRHPPATRHEGGSSTLARAVGAVLSLLVGAIYGAVGTVAHTNTLRIAGAEIPFGLVLALIGALALLVGFRLVFDDRLPVLCTAAGMVGIIALFSIASRGGSVLIPQGVPGLVWTVVPVLIATVVVAWPKLPPRPLVDGGAGGEPRPEA